MKKSLCASTAALALVPASAMLARAFAADLSIAPIYNAPPAVATWAGSYVGSQSRHLTESLELNPSVYKAGSTLSADARRAFLSAALRRPATMGAVAPSSQRLGVLCRSAQY